MDVLSEVLQAVRLNGAVYFDVNLRSPGAVATPAMAQISAEVMPGAQHVIAFHIMVAGSCWVETTEPASEPLLAEPGDIILIPKGDKHVMGSEPGHRPEPDMGLYFRPVDDTLPFQLSLLAGGGETARFVCGYLGCDAVPFNPLLDALPRLTVIKAGKGTDLTFELIKAALAERNDRRAHEHTYYYYR